MTISGSSLYQVQVPYSVLDKRTFAEGGTFPRATLFRLPKLLFFVRATLLRAENERGCVLGVHVSLIAIGTGTSVTYTVRQLPGTKYQVRSTFNGITL